MTARPLVGVDRDQPNEAVLALSHGGDDADSWREADRSGLVRSEQRFSQLQKSERLSDRLGAELRDLWKGFGADDREGFLGHGPFPTLSAMCEGTTRHRLYETIHQRETRGDMKAAVYYETGGPDVFRYEDVPDPAVSEDAVLVKVEVISLEGGDSLHRAGGEMASVPHVVGYQCAGVVIESGEKVAGLKVGGAVVTFGLAGSHA